MSNVATLNLWRPGQSGNPRGISSEAARQVNEARRQCQHNAHLAVAKLVELMGCGKPEVEKAAACEILDRAGVKAVLIDDAGEMSEVPSIRVEFVAPNHAAVP